MSSLLVQVATPVLQLGCALLVGFLAFRCEWVTEKQGLAFLTGRIGLPLLAFKAVATADLEDVKFLAVLSCFIGKLFVYTLAYLVCWLAGRKRQRSDILISMAIFSFHVTAANDFVFGIPIMQAFYPKTGMTNLVANAVVQNVLFQVCSLSVLGIGTAAQNAQLEVPDAQPSQAVRILKQLVQDPLLCAIVAAVLYSLVASVVVPHLTGPERLPWIVSQLVDFFTRPFSVTALLLTGANLATALETKSTQAAGSFYFVAIPVCLVVAKNFLCPYVSLAASELLLPGDGNNEWHSFAFLYGLIPTSSAPMLVAMRVGKHIEVVAAAVSIGILVAFPMLIASSVLLGRDQVDEATVDRQLRDSDLAALSISLASVLLCFFCFQLHNPESIWRKFPFKAIVWYVAACLFHCISGLIMDSLLPACSGFSAMWGSYCEIQRYIMICLMLHWMRRFERGLRADKTIWFALIGPLPFCIWAPTPLTKKMCILDGGSANSFYIIVGLAYFLALGGLTLWGLGGSREPTEVQENAEQPSFQLNANHLVEFEPDSPTCYQHLGTARRPSLELSGDTMEMRNLSAQALQDSFLEPEDQDQATANLKFSVLVIAAKCTLVLAISTTVRSILFLQPFHTGTESALVFGLMVVLLLANTEGLFVTLLVLCLFDTPVSHLSLRLRQRHRMARSRANSLQ